MNNRFLSVVLVILGLVVMAVAFIFFASNGMPYQDATAKQLAYQASEAKKYMIIFIIGFLVSVVGTYFIVMQVRTRKKINGRCSPD